MRCMGLCGVAERPTDVGSLFQYGSHSDVTHWRGTDRSLSRSALCLPAQQEDTLRLLLSPMNMHWLLLIACAWNAKKLEKRDGGYEKLFTLTSICKQNGESGADKLALGSIYLATVCTNKTVFVTFQDWGDRSYLSAVTNQLELPEISGVNFFLWGNDCACRNNVAYPLESNEELWLQRCFSFGLNSNFCRRPGHYKRRSFCQRPTVATQWIFPQNCNMTVYRY